jgi:hypothetical protein
MVGELENNKNLLNILQYFYNNFAKIPVGLQKYSAKTSFLQ